METRKQGQETFHVFEGMEDLLEVAERPSLTEHDNGREVSEERTKWSASKNLGEAIGFARYGEPKTLAAVEKASLTLRNELPDLREKYEWQPRFAEAGDDVDVGLYLSGEPECFSEFSQARQTGSRIARVCVQGSASAKFTPKELARQGQSALATVDALEAAGVRVELVWGLGFRAGKRRCFYEVTLKRAEEALDLSRLAFAAHPSALRRLGFALLDATVKGKERKEFGAGYGYACNLPGEFDVESVALDGREKDILKKARKALEKFTK